MPPLVQVVTMDDREDEGKASSALEAEPATEAKEAHGGKAAVGTMPFSARIAVAAGLCVARRPCGSLCSCCGIMFALTLSGILSGELAFSGDGSKDWQILDDKHTLMRDALELADNAVDCIPNANGTCPEVAVRSQANTMMGLGLNYVSSADNSTMFTPKRLQQACEIEQIVLNNPWYPKLCVLRAGALQEVHVQKREYNLTDCRPLSLSVVQLFYGPNKKCDLLPSDEVDKTARFLLDGLADPITRLQTGFFLEAGTEDSFPRMTRSIIALGHPLEGHETQAMDDRDLFSVSQPFWDLLENDLLAYYGKEHKRMRSAYWEPWTKGDVNLFFSSYALGQSEQQRVVNADTSFVLVAIIFVWAWLCGHTGSLFIGSISLMQIVLSIPVAFFFYRFIGQITYFQQLHSILIFIMLGVGADSVFVFSDAWQQSEELLRDAKTYIKIQGDDKTSILAARIAVAYQRTLVSVFNTSFTTGVAFLATSVSPIMPIRTMGIYACLLVLANYVFVITLTPAVFAAWHTYNLKLPCPCRFFPNKSVGHDPNSTTGQISGAEMSNGNNEIAADRAAAIQQPSPGGGFLERCFVPVFNRPGVAAASAVLLAAWGVANIYFTTRLEPPPEMFQYFGPAHMQTKAQGLGKDGFVSGTAADYLTLRLSFGISGVNRSPGNQSVDPWKPHLFSGVLTWDEGFDLSKPDAQDFLRAFCGRLRSAPCTQEACTDGLLFQPASKDISCFIEEFDTWNGGKRSDGQEFLQLLAKFRETQLPSHVLGGQTTWEHAIGIVGGQLKFVEIKARMTARSFLPGKLKEGLLEDLEKWLAAESSKAPASVGTILQTVGFDWVFYSLEKALVAGLFTGFAICFPVTFLVLVFATGNIIVALLAVLTIVLIVMSVLGWCWVVEGWYLGVSESIAGVIVIGLAVDYVIHLGHMYLEVGHLGYEKRAERWLMSLKSMGITVLAGAATTFMAGMSMRFCQMTFFIQMSTLISITIGYSLIYTIFFFMCILRIAGPEHRYGDIAAMWAWARASK